MRLKKEQIIKDTVNYGFARYLTLGISFIATIIQKRLLGPTLTGAWNALALIKMYSQFGELGISRGIELKIPSLFAQGKSDELEKLQNAGYSFTLVAAFIVNLLIFLATFFINHQNMIFILGIRLITAVSIIESIATYIESVSLRCKNRFSILGSQLIRTEIFFSVFSIVGIYFFKFTGLILAFLLMLVYRIIYTLTRTKDKFRIKFDRKLTFGLIRAGFPLLVFAFILRTFESLDRIVIVKNLGLDTLGYYSIALMVFASINDFSIVVSRIFYPRIVALFGSGKEKDKLVSYLLVIQNVLMMAVMALSAAAFFIFPLVIKYLLPKFIFGITSMQILVFCTLFTALYYLPLQYCIIMNKRWRLVFMISVLSLAYFFILKVSIRGNFLGLSSIDNIALMRVAINCVLFLILSCLAFFYLGHRKKFFVYIAKSFIFCLYYFLLIILINSLFYGPYLTLLDDIRICCLKIFIFFCAFAPIVFVINRDTGILNSIRQAYWPQVKTVLDDRDYESEIN